MNAAEKSVKTVFINTNKGDVTMMLSNGGIRKAVLTATAAAVAHGFPRLSRPEAHFL